MKKTYTLLFLLCALAQLSRAQYPYQAVIPGPTYAYSDGLQILHLRIDSIQTGNVTSYYHNYRNLQTYAGKMYLDSPDWMGSYMLERFGMDIEFVTRDGSYFIRTDQGVGGKWSFKTLNGNTYIEAEVIAQKRDTFLGVIDSVRYIRLLARDSNGIISHGLNYKELRLSRSYGLLDMPYFKDLLNVPVIYTLTGASHIPGSMYNLDARATFDIRPGDVRHIVQGEMMNYTDVLPGRMREYELRTCISRQELNNGALLVITDSVQFARMNYSFVNGQYTTTYSYIDTLVRDSIHLPDYVFLDKLVLQLSDTPLSKSMNSYCELLPYTYLKFYTSPVFYSLPGRQMKKKTFVYTSPGYWAKGIDDETYGLYIEGLGEYYISWLPSGSTYYRLPLYYRRGTESGGNNSFWHLALSSRDPEARLNVQLYPNPAQDAVMLQFFGPVSDQAHADIYTSDGLMLQRVPIYGNENELSTASWKPGCYFIRVTNGDKISWSRLIRQ